MDSDDEDDGVDNMNRYVYANVFYVFSSMGFVQQQRASWKKEWALDSRYRKVSWYELTGRPIPVGKRITVYDRMCYTLGYTFVENSKGGPVVTKLYIFFVCFS